MARLTTTTRRNRNRIQLDRTSLIILAAFIVLAIITAIVAFIVVRNMIAGWELTDLPGMTIKTTQTPGASLPGAAVPGSTVPLQEATGPTPIPWDGKSRVTVLVMGLDYEDVEERKIPRSDTMILLTLDPLTKTAGMLSIPRDLWVAIPGFDYGKINTAYFLGQANNLPGGGPGLAVKTVEQFIGVPIHYYAQIDFEAFERLIDLIGGVKLDIPKKITVDPIGPDNNVKIEAGRHTLNGKLALAYARARNTEGGDIDRAARQQQVIMAIAERVLSIEGFPRFIASAPQIYAQVSAGVQTNMSLQEAIQLGMLVQQIDLKSNLKQGIIGHEEAIDTFSPDGLSILKPFPDKIRLLRDSIFVTSQAVGPAAVAQDLETLMKNEAARVQILNGTDTAGLAGRTNDFLKAKGLQMADPGNADQVYPLTRIIDYTGKPYSVSYLVKLLNIQPSQIYSSYDPNAQVDVVIIIGNDWAANNSLP